MGKASKPKVTLRVTIDRAKWLTGTVCRLRNSNSYLLSDMPETKGMRCCLGFAGKVLGIPDQAMLGVVAPTSDAYVRIWESVGLIIGRNISNACYKLMGANDKAYGANTTHAGRETRISELGRKIGIKFTFTGTYPTK